MAQVVLEQLVKAYPDREGRTVRAVEGIDLTVEDREFMVLVGPSGCGKSTTLRMIAGLEEVTSGAVKIDGRVVNQVPPKDRDIAMVFQNYALYPHMTVRENMGFGLKLRGWKRKDVGARVDEAAAMLGLEGLLERKPKALSGGQRQRVALGRAIVRKPKVFLFDEPLSNLDAKMRVATRMELARLRTRLQATMIYVTHDQVEAMTLGDRICVMKEGRILQVDRPMVLYREPMDVFVGGFIGSPPMNFLKDARLGGTEGRVLGIRPERISLHGEGVRVRARVELFEPMGAEAFAHARLESAGAASGPGEAFVARVDPGERIAPGERAEFVFDLREARWFDAASGRAIAASAA